MSPNLLAVVYESARLHPAGPLLQRCSLQHGNYFFPYDFNGDDKNLPIDSLMIGILSVSKELILWSV